MEGDKRIKSCKSVSCFMTPIWISTPFSLLRKLNGGSYSENTPNYMNLNEGAKMHQLCDVDAGSLSIISSTIIWNSLYL